MSGRYIGYLHSLVGAIVFSTHMSLLTIVGAAIDVIISYHFYEITGSPLGLGLLYFYPMALRIFLPLVAGLATRSVGPLFLLLLLYFYGLAIDLIYYLIIPLEPGEVPLVYILVAVSGLAGPFYAVIMRTVIPMVTPRDLVLRANSILSFSLTAAQAVSSAFGGFLAYLLGYKGALLALIAIDLASLVPLIYLSTLIPRGRVYGEAGDIESRPAFLGILGGAVYITRSRVIMALLILSTAAGFFETQFFAVYLLASVKDLLRGGAEVFGLLATIINIGGILGSLAVNIYRQDRALLAAILSALSGASIAPIALAHDFIVYAASLSLLGFLTVQSSILITTIYQTTIDREKQPIFFGFATFLGNTASALGALAGGYIASTLGLANAIIIASTGIIVTSVSVLAAIYSKGLEKQSS